MKLISLLVLITFTFNLYAFFSDHKQDFMGMKIKVNQDIFVAKTFYSNDVIVEKSGSLKIHDGTMYCEFNPTWLADGKANKNWIEALFYEGTVLNNESNYEVTEVLENEPSHFGYSKSRLKLRLKNTEIFSFPSEVILYCSGEDRSGGLSYINYKDVLRSFSLDSNGKKIPVTPIELENETELVSKNINNGDREFNKVHLQYHQQMMPNLYPYQQQMQLPDNVINQ